MMKMPKTVLKTSVALVTLLSFVAPALAMPLDYRAIAAGAADQPVTQVQYQEGGYGRGYGGADDRDGQFRGGYGGADYGDRGYGGAGNDSREDRRGGYGGARQGWDDRRDWRQDRRDERRAERERERQREWARERERERERQWARERDRRDGYYNGHRGSRDRRPGYREHNGYWYPLAAFAVGAIIGGAVNGNNNRAQPAYGGSHHEWCANRWRSYRASDNSYQPSNGPRQACVSPYMR